MTKTKIASAADDGLVAGNSGFSGLRGRCLVAALAVLMIAQVAVAQTPQPTEAQRQAIRAQIEQQRAADAKAHPAPPPDAAAVRVAEDLAKARRAMPSRLAAPAPAATGPLSLPLWDGSGMSQLGSWSVPGMDGGIGLISYGGAAVGVSRDGKFLFANCYGTVDASWNVKKNRGLITKLEIPPIGGTARVVQPCVQGVSPAKMDEIAGAGAYEPTPGSVIERADGSVVIGNFITYDAAGPSAPRKTFMAGPLTSLAGMFEGSVRNGLVKGQGGYIPAEWQALLGGDVFVLAGYSSIVSRSSYDPAFTAFYAADVVKAGFTMQFLLGCPYYIPGTSNMLPQCVGRYGSPSNPLHYNGSEHSGGAFFVAGTRTLAFVERESDGPTCYGYATTNKADHGKPYLDAVYCYSLSDPQNQKGPMGYPYRLVVKAYDLADLVAVKQGAKLPWDLNPYAVYTMPGSTPDAVIGYYGGGAYNHVTGQYYLTQEFFPGANGNATVRVWQFPTAAAPPPPPPPAPTGSLTASATTCEAPCSTTLTWTSANGTPDMDGATIAASGSRQIAYTAPGAFTYTLTVTGPAGTTPYRQSVTVTVTAQPPPPPPPPTPKCVLTITTDRAPDGTPAPATVTQVCKP